MLRRARQGVSAHFFVMGMISGVWMARIPAVKAQAGLSDAALGVALFAVPVGLVLGAALAERLVDRVGSALVRGSPESATACWQCRPVSPGTWRS